ncbi:H-NS family nucleoid-associated regulatory protein [Polaromonas sp.]|uniref:H-NS family nucleoid-associated regulatory protein n=1 Tax=Polaromonas sp. TaxID=1869339 RepID=UPI00352A475D
MAKSYTQIQAQIEQLQRQAQAIRDAEISGVVDRIKVAIAHYGLTAEQLGFDKRNTTSSAPIAKSSIKQVANAKSKGKARFSDRLGNQWSGRGPRPGWLREALQAGHDINEFRIGNRTKPKKTLVPLVDVNNKFSGAGAAKPAGAKRRMAKVSYADDAGHTWSGMGPKPAWLKSAIEGGKSLADFAR